MDVLTNKQTRVDYDALSRYTPFLVITITD